MDIHFLYLYLMFAANNSVLIFGIKMQISENSPFFMSEDPAECNASLKVTMS